MELSDLSGFHVLTTAAVMSRVVIGGEDCDVMSIGIDGNTYTFYEDGNDGYRSCLGYIQFEEGLDPGKLLGATTINRDVWIHHHTFSRFFTGECDLIEIVDAGTGHTWAWMGTENIDDYYPGCILEWNAMDPVKLAKSKVVRPMLGIPVDVAKAVAEEYGYDQVVIYARRVGEEPNPYGEHMTTYGINSAHCGIAAKMGETLRKFMGWNV